MCDKEQKIPFGDACGSQRVTAGDSCTNYRTSSNQNCRFGEPGDLFCKDGEYCWPDDLTVENAGWKYGLRLDNQAQNIINSQTNGYVSSCRSLSPGQTCNNSWTDAQVEFGFMPGIDIVKCGGSWNGKCWEVGDQGEVWFEPENYNSCQTFDNCATGYIKDPDKKYKVCRTATGCTTDDCCMLHDCDKHGPPYGATEEVWAEWVHRCPTQAAQEMDRQCATDTYAGKAPYGTTDQALWARWARKCPKENAGCGGNKRIPMGQAPWGASEKDWANWVRWCPAEVKAMMDVGCKNNWPNGPPYGTTDQALWAKWDRECRYQQKPVPRRCTTSPDTWDMGDGRGCQP